MLARLTDVLQSVKSFKAMGRENVTEDVLRDDTQRLRRALKREVLGNSALEAGQEPMYTTVVALQAADLTGDADLFTQLFGEALAVADVAVSLNLRSLPVGQAHSALLERYGLNRDSVLQLDLSPLLQLVPQHTRFPETI